MKENLVSKRSEPKRKFDQFGVTEGTLQKRADFLKSHGFLKDAKLLFLGDYDLTSLACLPKVENSELWVLDVDEEVVETVKEGGQGRVKTVQHDLSNPLPKRLLSSFDFVFSDPPYTKEGVSLFLSRALKAFTSGDRARIVLSYTSLDPTRVQGVQEVVLEHGLAIEELCPKFNEYISAKTIGNYSDLYILRPTAKAKPLIRGVYKGRLYTHE